MKPWRVSIDDVYIEGRKRAADPRKVSEIAASIKQIGLLDPPAIYIAQGIVIDGEDAGGVYKLVYGLHRLLALKELGETVIDVKLLDIDDDEAEMIEIAENLHRNDLTKDERYAQVRRYAELLEKKRGQKPPQVGEVSPNAGGRGNKGIAAEVAEQTGLGRETVRRILNPEAAELERERQREIRERAKEHSEHDRREAERTRKEIEKHNKDMDTVVRLTAAEEFANFLHGLISLEQLPTVLSWIEGTKPKDVAAALRRIAA